MRYINPRFTYLLTYFESRLDLSGSHDVIGHVTIRFPLTLFPIGGPMEPQASISNGFRDIQWRM